MDRHELAWAAGLFDGEGWAALEIPADRRTGQPKAQVNQADPDGIPQVLERFRRAVGCGQIYGPRCYPSRIDLYSWVASSRPNVSRTWELLAPWLGPVKMNQLAAALGSSPTTDGWDRATELERRAWAAGLFDGEGSTCLLEHRSRNELRVGEMSVTQSSDFAVPLVLRRFGDLATRGRVYGPVRYKDKTPVYRWKACALDDILLVLHLIGPFAGRVKMKQASRVIGTLLRQPAIPRGNPAWGNRKTHCVHGHEYASARMKPFISRGKNVSRRDSRQCLACLREYARRKREQRGK